MHFQDLDRSSPQGQHLLQRLADRHGAALADAARALDRLFLLGSDWAPGLYFVGGRTSDVPLGPAGVFSIAGAAGNLEDALASAAGEAIERAAQVERPGDITRQIPLGTAALPSNLRALADTRAGPELQIDCVAGRDAITDASIEVPADWCLRRTPPGPLLIPGAALSTGTAAGRDPDDAATRALLELIERDAAALWWLGGRPARRLSVEHPTLASAVKLLAVYRQVATARQTHLFDISTDLEIPVIAAVSTDPDGHMFACGLGSRLSRSAAAMAAITELCQSEIGIQFAAAKRQQLGDAALSDTDRNHLARAARVNLDRMPAYTAPQLADPVLPQAASGARALATHMAECGAAAVLVDMTRGPVSVVKAIAPDLQPYPADIGRPRLTRTRREFGGAVDWTDGCSLV
jgi:ribosomal protein S12 methylthiotransferase accessory factor